MRLYALRLGQKVWNDGFRPDYLIGVWRGGTTPAMVIHEYLRMQGHDPYHTVMKTQSYRGIKRRTSKVEIRGLQHLISMIKSRDRLLLVDDVFDTGHTMAAVVEAIRSSSQHNNLDFRIASVFYKPSNNETKLEPHYYEIEDDRWIVFPHELEGLTENEIRAKGSEIATVVLGMKPE